MTPVNHGNDDNKPDDTFEDAREIASYPVVGMKGTILIDAVGDNGGDFEFFKVSIANNKNVSWSVTPEASNTRLHFDVYEPNREHKGSANGRAVRQ